MNARCYLYQLPPKAKVRYDSASVDFRRDTWRGVEVSLFTPGRGLVTHLLPTLTVVERAADGVWEVVR